MSELVNVMVMDDFPVVRNALTEAFERDERLAVRASCESGRGLLDALVECEPDVALMDLHVPDIDGTDLIMRVRRLHPNVRVVVCTACERASAVVSALHAGAHGYVVKRQDVREIADAVVAVHHGHMTIAPQVTAATLQCGGDGTDGRTDALNLVSNSELEMLRRVAAGQTDDVIARALYISPRTVQNRLSKLRSVAGVARRTDLVRWAIDSHLV
jgi:DNA-binding NarL/FixJ family response regulator